MANFRKCVGNSGRVNGRRLAGALLTLVLVISGCSSVGDRAESAESTAARFLRDVGDGNGDAACAVLVPNTVAELEKSDKKPCAEAILSEDLPEPGEAGKTATFSGRAR